MTPSRTFDASGLPPFDVSNKAPLFLGQVLLCLSEASVFFVLIGTYFYLRLGVDAWPPPGIQRPGIILPTLALIPMIASCAGSYMASEAAKKDDRRGMIVGLGINLGLAIIAMVLRGVEWSTFNFTWASDAHGSIVWSILFIHTLDVVADLMMTAVLMMILALGKHGPKQRIGVHVDSVLWYFLMAIWLPLYVVIYWGPQFVGVSR